jgi:hypothetical protein
MVSDIHLYSQFVLLHRSLMLQVRMARKHEGPAVAKMSIRPAALIYWSHRMTLICVRRWKKHTKIGLQEMCVKCELLETDLVSMCYQLID